ncbi:MAG: hypothetical protein ACE5WD_07785 [Candidatus Aminicenantia bacterium]
MEIVRKVKYEAELDKQFLGEIIEMSGCEEIERCIQCNLAHFFDKIDSILNYCLI